MSTAAQLLPHNQQGAQEVAATTNKTITQNLFDGVVTVSMTAGNVAASATPADETNPLNFGTIQFTGAPGVVRTYTVPASTTGKRWFYNTCGQTVTVKTPTDAGVAVANNERKELLWDGTGVASISGLLPANNLGDVASAATSRTNLGLGNVDNTSDASKISTLLASARSFLAGLTSQITDVAATLLPVGLTIDRRVSTGTPGAGFGTRLLFKLDSATVAGQNAAYIDVFWDVATYLSRTSFIAFGIVVSGVETEKLRIGTSGVKFAGLSSSQVVKTDASGYLVSAAPGTAFNSDWGTTTTTTARGDYPSPAFVTLVDGATIIWDCTLRHANAVVTLGGNRTLSITNAVSGCTGFLRVVQDGTGGRSLTLPTGSKIFGGGGTAPALSTAAAAVDGLSFVYDGTTFWWSLGKAAS